MRLANRKGLRMILHFDFSTGASGDKILGSLIELCETLGVTGFEDVCEVATRLVPGTQVERLSVVQGGIHATCIAVHEDSPPHRHWDDIRDLIESAERLGVLSEQALRFSLSAFEAIAVAEAAVHGVELDHVHFHEIGAADSIIDICCSSYLLDRLAPEVVYATPLALGFGSFLCSHGEMPIPAPATARLIEGLPVFAGVHEGELTTPTGAALARSFVTTWTQLPCVRPLAAGYGAGSRTIPGAANVVRVIAGERAGTAGLACDVKHAQDGSEGTSRDDSCADTFFIEGCALLETNIDHLSPEALAFACEELLCWGALDVWQEPITMKKGRLAVRLSVLARAHEAQQAAEIVIRLTGTLGVRSTYVERTIVSREVLTRHTSYGDLRYKTALIGTPDGQIKVQRPEYEDVARLAREQGLDFNTLYEELSK